MEAVRDHGRPRVDHLSRLRLPAAIGVDETSFLAATATHPTLLVTGFVDLDRHRLIDVVPGRSAAAVSDWLGSKPEPWLAGIATAVIDPYAGYARGLAEGLPAARLVVDHFHAVRLANQALDEVRRRVQQTTLGHRGWKGDPLYRIRRRLLAAHDRLGTRGFEAMLVLLEVGDPTGEVAAAYLADRSCCARCTPRPTSARPRNASPPFTPTAAMPRCVSSAGCRAPSAAGSPRSSPGTSRRSPTGPPRR